MYMFTCKYFTFKKISSHGYSYTIQCIQALARVHIYTACMIDRLIALIDTRK